MDLTLEIDNASVNKQGYIKQILPGFILFLRYWIKIDLLLHMYVSFKQETDL